ncbi:MAG: asparagine synthase, partial [Oscillospiraceae bacterium]|nr:asparagine synthase [Oscillospiraceae bacterium]
ANVDKTFTVGFSEDNGRYSEMHLAAELSAELNCANYQKTITAKEYWGALPRVAYHMDEPLADPSAVALFFVNQLASQHLKVVMSGEGSDELFGGYNIYHEPFSLRPFKLVPRGLKAKIGKKLEQSPKNFRGKNYIIRGCKTLEERFIGNAHLMDAEEKRSILKSHIPATEPSVLTKAAYENSKHLDDVSRMQDIDLRFWLPGDILLKADKMSMAHSLEIRVPFLDKKVFSAAQKLAIQNKVRKKTTKFAFREIAAECLPEASSQRKKLGFPVPIRVWLKQPEYYNLVKDAFQSNTAEEFFSTDALVKLLDAHYNGEKDNSRKIWAIFQFLVWHKVYFDEFEHFRPICEKARV